MSSKSNKKKTKEELTGESSRSAKEKPTAKSSQKVKEKLTGESSRSAKEKPMAKSSQKVKETLTAEYIIAERIRRQQYQDEIKKYEEVPSETSEEDEDIKRLSDKIPKDSNDINFDFKHHGHPIFCETSTNFEEDDALKPMSEIDRYIFLELLSNQFWDKISEYFANKPYTMEKLSFTLMTTSVEHAESCKWYLLSDSISWVPSYGDIIDAFCRWGVSPLVLKDEETESVDSKMECEESAETNCQDTESTSNTDSYKMSDEQIMLIRLTLEYLELHLAKSNMSLTDTFNLVTVLLKISLDRSCMKLLEILGSLISSLLNSFSTFDEEIIRKLGENLLKFKTKTANKIFISINVIPSSHRGRLLSAHFSYLIIQEILEIRAQPELKNLQSILDIFQEHEDKINALTPINIYFTVLSLMNITYTFGIDTLNVTELSTFVAHINSIRKLPQIQVRSTNKKFISNFVDWCMTFWNFPLEEKKEWNCFESPKKSPRKSPKKQHAKSPKKTVKKSAFSLSQ